MKSIILVAPPAAGKGTQSELISEHYNIPTISIGALLRDEVKAAGKHAVEIENNMNNAELVREDLVLELISNRISKDDCKEGYILDGFPRNVEQAIDYDKEISKISGKINYVFEFDISFKEAVKRITGRVSCPNCLSVYNNDFEAYKPKVEGICDNCGTELEARHDDNAETFKKRYDYYIDETKTLITYYKEKNVLYNIDSSISKEHTFNQIKSVLDGDKNEY